MMQPKWAGELNPLLDNPVNQSTLLTGVKLINGVTVVNHLLGRQMQGWMVADQNSAASIYRSAPMNALTLTLTSNADVTVNLVVF